MNTEQIQKLADILKREPTLEWKPADLPYVDVNTFDAFLGDKDDGVQFSLQYQQDHNYFILFILSNFFFGSDSSKLGVLL